MRTVLITGANGEIGHGLISRLADTNGTRIVALDLHTPEESLRKKCYRSIVGDITDSSVVENLGANYDFDVIIHLAALLSTKSERMPKLAHLVNVDGTLNLLELAISEARQQGKALRFIYPSSIAVYGFPTLEAKNKAGKIQEHEWTEPRTMYGINKLYCEKLGIYYQKFYRQLDAQESKGLVHFRGIRFPGLISAHTLPTGGTSDFAPELHVSLTFALYVLMHGYHFWRCLMVSMPFCNWPKPKRQNYVNLCITSQVLTNRQVKYVSVYCNLYQKQTSPLFQMYDVRPL
ncbi:MAG TPA: NAD-dependent epimerase/dehydratase family protein [Gemmatales bacterium]|nr:NAD-dependent epimerase/dehydratase family protein [Gemmatales bacterium]